MRAAVALAIAASLGVGGILVLPKEGAIASYATPLVGRSRSQRHNATLSAERLNGAVIAPGGTFSFNERVGTFSMDAGYRKAPVSYNGQLIDDWGGGVCQTSTTLYNTALLAGMEILERHRHRFAPSYVPPGRDAAVAFTNIDLRFRNPHPFPVRIVAQAERDLRVSFVSSGKLRSRPSVLHEVKHVSSPSEFKLGRPGGSIRVRNSGKAGYQVAVYRIWGSTRERISEDTYPVMNRILEYR